MRSERGVNSNRTVHNCACAFTSHSLNISERKGPLHAHAVVLHSASLAQRGKERDAQLLEVEERVGMGVKTVLPVLTLLCVIGAVWCELALAEPRFLVI